MVQNMLLDYILHKKKNTVKFVSHFLKIHIPETQPSKVGRKIIFTVFSLQHFMVASVLT